MKYFIEIMSTNNNLTWRYDQIFISYAHDDNSNAANPPFSESEKVYKEFNAIKSSGMI